MDPIFVPQTNMEPARCSLKIPEMKAPQSAGEQANRPRLLFHVKCVGMTLRIIPYKKSMAAGRGYSQPFRNPTNFRISAEWVRIRPCTRVIGSFRKRTGARASVCLPLLIFQVSLLGFREVKGHFLVKEHPSWILPQATPELFKEPRDHRKA